MSCHFSTVFARLLCFAALVFTLGCASGTPAAIHSRGPIEGVYAFDTIVLDFDRDRSRIVFRVEGLVDCSSETRFCFYGPSDMRLAAPRNCSALEAQHWEAGGVATRVVGRDPDTGDAILMTDGAPRTLFQYNRAQDVVGIYYDPSAKPMFEQDVTADVLRAAREVGAYHARTSFDFLFRCT